MPTTGLRESSTSSDAAVRLAAKRTRIDELSAWAQSLVDEVDAIRERSLEVRREISELEWDLARLHTTKMADDRDGLYIAICRKWKTLRSQVDELTARMGT